METSQLVYMTLDRIEVIWEEPCADSDSSLGEMMRRTVIIASPDPFTSTQREDLYDLFRRMEMANDCSNVRNARLQDWASNHPWVVSSESVVFVSR